MPNVTQRLEKADPYDEATRTECPPHWAHGPYAAVPTFERVAS